MARPRGVPPALLRRANRIVRPRDAEYVDPWAEFRRLEDRGVLQRVARGYYVLPPDRVRGGDIWHVPVEAVGLGIAVADYGVDEAATMGISAARLLGAVPRALASAVVAVPKQRPLLETERGRIHFVRRRVEVLDRVRVRTEIVQGWSTSPEQTVIDLADRPALGGVTPTTVSEAITNLASMCDWELVVQLAEDQRKSGALTRASWLAAAVIDVPIPRRASRRKVPSEGLSPLGAEVDPDAFGITP